MSDATETGWSVIAAHGFQPQRVTFVMLHTGWDRLSYLRAVAEAIGGCWHDDYNRAAGGDSRATVL